MIPLQKIKHLLGFHNPFNCVETGEEKFEYQSAFDLCITRYISYQCIECKRKFWMPPMSFHEWKWNEQMYRLTLTTVKNLEKQGRYEEAIEILKM